MALGLGVVETAGIAVAIVAVGIAARHYRSGGDVSVEADEGGIDFDASSNGEDETIDYATPAVSTEDEPAAEGTVEGDGEAEMTVTSHDGGTALQDISGVGASRANALAAAGFFYAEDVAEASVEDLTATEGVGEARAENLQAAAEDAVSGNGDDE